VPQATTERLLSAVLGPRLTPEYAGAGAAAAPAPTGPPLTGRQVAAAVGGVLLLLLFFMLYVNRENLPSRPGPPVADVPVVGGMGEAIAVGGTVWGVAFLEHPERFGSRAARGQYFAIGVIAGNRSIRAFTLTARSVGLIDAETGARYTPLLTAWGTPRALSAGRYTSRYPLAPHASIAGLLIFDVPVRVDHARLLVRDLTLTNTAFTGAIELERGARTGMIWH
jgi:hypothetical protein